MVPTIYPTGTTIYDPNKCWNGFTLFERGNDALLIDMNGNIVNCWEGMRGSPNKILPGGFLMGSSGERNPRYGYQDKVDLTQVDWEGNVVWQFNKYELIKDDDEKPCWMSRQHHDYQREGNPVGYYAPGLYPLVDKGNTLILSHKNLRNLEISNRLLLDDVIIEVTWDGEIIWEWKCGEHFEELGFDDIAKRVLQLTPHVIPIGEGIGDWMHINSMSVLGPNKWYDSGDSRFHPDNIIWSSRQSNILAIVERKTGQIVWRLGPDYENTETLRNFGQVIGPHHVHMIPQGLPGEGNILVFDNGGWGGYGVSSPGAPHGFNNALRDHSRVVEFDPTSLKIVWKYTPREAGFLMPMSGHHFYSNIVSSAQRLPNGNTLITEGVGGRILEITPEYEISWEYVSPYIDLSSSRKLNMIYRSYRVPYDWVPQAERTQEQAVNRVDNNIFRVPGSIIGKVYKTTTVNKEHSKMFDSQYCVLPTEE